MEPYPSGQLGFIDDPDRQFGNGSVWTRTRTHSHGPEPLLTLLTTHPIPLNTKRPFWTMFRMNTVQHIDVCSVSNGSSFGPGRYYRSAWQRPYAIKNRRFFKRTITLRPQILIREYSVWYVKYAALHGASFGRLRFSISLNLSKRQPKNFVFTPKMTIISKPLAEF